jgi:hypothetical protein
MESLTPAGTLVLLFGDLEGLRIDCPRAVKLTMDKLVSCVVFLFGDMEGLRID